MNLCPISIRLDEDYLEIMVNVILNILAEFENNDEDGGMSIQPLGVIVFYSPQKRVKRIQINYYYLY